MTKQAITEQIDAVEKLWQAVKADAADGTVTETDGPARKLLQARMVLVNTLHPYRTKAMIAAEEHHTLETVGDGLSVAPDEEIVHPDSVAAYRRLYGVYDSTIRSLKAALDRK